MAFDPDRWTTSFFRELKAYVLGAIDSPGVYDLQMSYPDPVQIVKMVPLTKTLIHFEIDNLEQRFFGLGENVVADVVDETEGTVEAWEAHTHEVTMNVGVWASVQSGGVSARLVAREDLDRLFNGPAARDALMAASDGVEILSFTGGQFVNDAINDVPLFRIVDMDLRLRVFSRTKKVPVVLPDDRILSPGIEIDETVIIG